jgi:hypothetical protein
MYESHQKISVFFTGNRFDVRCRRRWRDMARISVSNRNLRDGKKSLKAIGSRWPRS